MYSITVGFSPTLYCWPKVTTSSGEPAKIPCSGFVLIACVMYTTTTMCDGVLHCLWFASNLFWCPCMAINVNVQYNGGFLPDIILWTQCYLHRGTCLNASMKRFCIICSLLIPPKRFDIFSPITGGCSKGLGVV